MRSKPMLPLALYKTPSVVKIAHVIILFDKDMIGKKIYPCNKTNFWKWRSRHTLFE